MRYIKLTNGGMTKVDDEDFEELSKYKWRGQKEGKTTYVRAKDLLPLNIITGKYRLVRMHRILMKPSQGMEIDHINGDGLDNRKSNLRVCTHRENCMNRGMRSSNKSGFKGVRKYRRKWISQIKVNNKVIILGYFDTPEIAHKAYCTAAKKYHGEFANFGWNVKEP